MPTTLTISLASISGEAGPFTLFLRKKSDRTLVNSGGDALTEVQVSTVNTGVWTATVAETLPAEDCHARIYEGTSEAAASILIDSILYEGETEIGKEPGSGGGLTTEQANQLEAIALAAAGGSIETTGRIAEGGTVTAYIGDDFRVRSGTQLEIPVADIGGALYTKLNTIGAANLNFAASRPDKGPGEITGTVASLSQTSATLFKIVVEITNCGSGLLPDDYVYQIEQRQTQGSEIDSFVEIEGTLVLKAKS